MVLAAALLGFTACERENFSAHEPGTTVTFKAAAGYSLGADTKTAYSGEFFNGSGVSVSYGTGYERINWLSSDEIRIYCNEANDFYTSNKWADYRVQPTGNPIGKEDFAKISAVSGNGLQWGTTWPHRFLAIYPSPNMNSSNPTPAPSSINVSMTMPHQVSLYMPSAQSGIEWDETTYTLKPNMNFAFMAANKAVYESESGNVELAFYPLFNAFEFQLQTLADDPITGKKLTQIKLEDLNTTGPGSLAGPYTVTFMSDNEAPSNAISVPDNIRSIILNLPGDGVELKTDQALKATLLTAPKISDCQLKLTLTFSGDFTRSLELKDNGSFISIDPYKKVYIKLGVPATGAFTYVFSETDPTGLVYEGGTTTGSVVSYKYSDGSDIPANRTDVAWTVEGYYDTEAHALAGGSEGQYADMAATGLLTAYTPATQTGSYAGETVNITYKSGLVTTTIDRDAEITARLRSNAPRGTIDDPWNLANPINGSNDYIVETANTYIVNAPGWYSIPLVMGNGVKNNAKNTTAYAQPNFVNYKGQALASTNSPYLLDYGEPKEAYIVWEEADMVQLNTTGNWSIYYAIRSTVEPWSLPSDMTTHYFPYVSFHIEEDKIKPGCIVIAVTDQDDVVMWSWTVWVTDYVPCNYSAYSAASDLADVECTYDAAGNKVTFMPQNLGWVEDKIVEERYPAKDVYVRLKQDESDLVRAMKISRPAGEGCDRKYGHNPYYQWGRKDALIPGAGDRTQDLSGLYGRSTTPRSVFVRQSMATAIQTPDTHYGYEYPSSNPTYDWCTTTDFGWWCAGNTSVKADKATVKTIYDPSPVGYTMPRYNAFNGLRVGTGEPNIESYIQRSGAYFWNGYRANVTDPTAGMKTIFFPLSGYRYGTDGVISLVGQVAMYPTAVSSALYTGDYGGYIVDPEVGGFNRCYGFNVRPAREQATIVNPNTVNPWDEEDLNINLH